ncbi:MAG: TetR/AcrR family transcriptional regulator [Alphaproteobacteria bacterium]|nr:TetR/AcrR family transcriptional regulator [Alphaproteobacteria bacterium]
MRDGSEGGGTARGQRLVRADWIEAARGALVAGGIASVKVDRLAAGLGVTRGSFYWHFVGRSELLEALLRHWEATNTAPMEQAVAAAGPDGHARFAALVRLWIDEVAFSPAYDAAVRDWARHAPAAAAAVRRIDDRRIALLAGIFADLGYAGTDAFVRARVAYFHQVGYYALAIREPHARRLDLMPYYYRALTGLEMPPHVRGITGSVSDDGRSRLRKTVRTGERPKGRRAK